MGHSTASMPPSRAQEKAFTYFDSSSDGYLEKTELVQVKSSHMPTFRG